MIVSHNTWLQVCTNPADQVMVMITCFDGPMLQVSLQYKYSDSVYSLYIFNFDLNKSHHN
jgi:hypothetical protein